MGRGALGAPHLLASITRAQQRFLGEERPADAFDALLGDLLELTQSEYGFIGEIVLTPDGVPYLRTYAITNIAWNDATRQMFEQRGPTGLEFHNLETLFGAVIRTGQPVIANDPAADPRRGGLPAGHPPLRAFLGIPFRAGGELVGMAGVANRPGGYDVSLLAEIEPFTVTCGSLVAARRAAFERRSAEASLLSRQALDALIVQIARRFVEVAPEGVDAAIEEALRQVMEHVGAQRIVFALPVEGGASARITHAVGALAAPAIGLTYRLADLPSVMRLVREDGFFFLHNASELPEGRESTSAFPDARAVAVLRAGAELNAAGCAIHWHEPTPALPESELRALCVLPGLITAVLARKDAQDSLRKSEEQFRTLADLLPQAVLVLDEKRGPVFANRAAAVFSGDVVTTGEASGLVAHPEDLKRLAAAAREATKLRQRMSLEARLRVGDGSYRPFLIDHVPSQSGASGAGLWTAFDLSEHRELEGRVREAEKLEAVGRLAGGIAHDFNNILTAISGHAELAEARSSSGRSVDKDLAGIRRAAGRAAELTRHLLAFARRRPVQPRVLDLNTLVAGVETLLRRLIGEHIVLSVSTSAEPLCVDVDPSQIEQVIVNLAVNARDAMPQGGSLEIATQRLEPGGWAELRVTDSGSGMDAATRAHVFEPFFTTKEVGRGTGLGLATSYGIVCQSGGEIQLESEPNVGTTVRVRLPISAAPPEAELLNLRPRSSPAGTEMILLVEDDQALREIAETSLGSLGYEVASAADASGARALLDGWAGRPIQLLITDVVMPHGSGLEVSHWVRQSFPKARVLYVSGYSTTFDPAVVTRDGHGAFLAKPFTPSELAGAGRRLLDAP